MRGEWEVLEGDTTIGAELVATCFTSLPTGLLLGTKRDKQNLFLNRTRVGRVGNIVKPE